MVKPARPAYGVLDANAGSQEHFTFVYPYRRITDMAELEVKSKQSQTREGERSQSAGQIARRRESDDFPSLFDMSGGELFNMWPSMLLRRISDEMDRMMTPVSPARGSRGCEGRSVAARYRHFASGRPVQRER